MFWRLTPRKIEPFISVYNEEKEYEVKEFREKANFSAWLQGIYISRAINANFAKNVRYFEEPINFHPQEDSSALADADAAKFEAWALKHNAGMQKRISR